MNKKQRKQQQLEQKSLENKKFNRVLIISFCVSIIMVVSALLFYTYRCETRFLYRKWAWYGKPITNEWICMNGNNLQLHKSSKVMYKNKTFNFCSQHCFDHLVHHYNEVSMTVDAYSKDTIYKAEAISGLKARGSDLILYFKDEETFEKYYEQKSNRSFIK